ncbi:homeobox domain-containing protein [Zalerion maritima]|uniref:Homeobox domain-containing protein n=1 Tax=Zalerion maritima TaxID=339359 RepID=A0AAD5RTA2_9PEZI|nr:homeobox domain-containing protein [Zalerion maritima]
MAHFRNNAVPEAPGILWLRATSYHGYSPEDSRPMNPHWGPRPEPKRRLSKEELALLESEFQKIKKPNSSLKQGLAGRLGVDIARINNWFQNRRAKQKQIIRAAEMEENRKAENIELESPSPEVKKLPPLSAQNDLPRPSMVAFSTYTHQSALPQTEPVTQLVSVNIPTKEVMETQTPSEALHSEFTSQNGNKSPPHTGNNVDFTQASDPLSQCKFPGLTWTQSPGMSDQATGGIAASTVPFSSGASAGNGDFPLISSNALHQKGLHKFPPNTEAQAGQDVSQLSIPFPQGFQFESSPAVDLASRRRRPTSPVPPGIQGESRILSGGSVMDQDSWLLSFASGYELQEVLRTTAALWSPLAENNHKGGTWSSLLPEDSPGAFVDLNPRMPLAIPSPNPLDMCQYHNVDFAISDEQHPVPVWKGGG